MATSGFDEWFRDNGLEKYKSIFIEQGFNDLNTIAEISSKEDVQEMGISLLGEKLMLMSKIRELKTALNQTKNMSYKTVTDVLMPRKKQSSMNDYSVNSIFVLMYFAYALLDQQNTKNHVIIVMLHACKPCMLLY